MEEAPSVPSGLVPEFYIPATASLFERRPRTLKHGDTFAMFDHYGDLVAGPYSPEGIFHQDTRFLSRFTLTVGGERPLLLSSTVQNNNSILNVDLTNADVFDDEALMLSKDTLHVSRAKFLLDSVCYERLAVRNHGDRRCRVTVALDYDADFADMFEIRGHRREHRGVLTSEVAGDRGVRFVYAGLDEIDRSTRIVFTPAPARCAVNRAEFELELDPKAQAVIFATIHCSVGHERPLGDGNGFFKGLRRARRALVHAGARSAAVETSNSVVNEVLCRSMADLTMLVTDTRWGPYPYAGIPWFCTTFGRDGIITAIEMLWVDPGVARGVLRFLAAHQAKFESPEADAEPGKILHEGRECELARLGEVPFGCYYGSVDSTPLFLVLAGLYWERTCDHDTIREIWPQIRAALDWIDKYGDRDGDGFVEYNRKGPHGLTNQGWKDSGDSVFHQDGTLATGPIALVEVQGYVYFAKIMAARMARRMEDEVLAATLDDQARQLKEQFEQRFWCDDMGFYALALDGQKRPCKVRTSNAGHLLFTGIASQERCARVARTLFSPEFFSGWGIRTVSGREVRFNPMSYHNGSIWPHDNAIIGLGLARMRCLDEMLRLTTSMFAAATYMDLRRLPELFCGFHRHRETGPTLYPIACAPQAWAAGAPFALLEACLGLEFEAAEQTIRLRHPRMPEFLDWVRIRNLRIGESRLDVLLRRHGVDVAVNVLARDGPVKLEVEL